MNVTDLIYSIIFSFLLNNHNHKAILYLGLIALPLCPILIPFLIL